MNSPLAAPIWRISLQNHLWYSQFTIFNHFKNFTQYNHPIIVSFLYGIKTCLLFFEQQLLNAKKKFAFSGIGGRQHSHFWDLVALASWPRSANRQWKLQRRMKKWWIKSKGLLIGKSRSVCGQDHVCYFKSWSFFTHTHLETTLLSILPSQSQIVQFGTYSIFKNVKQCLLFLV